ncbi:hypothetical protein EMIT0111MI5_11138 [Burkholderia sp. IT-111MI5]
MPPGQRPDVKPRPDDVVTIPQAAQTATHTATRGPKQNGKPEGFPFPDRRRPCRGSVATARHTSVA